MVVQRVKLVFGILNCNLYYVKILGNEKTQFEKWSAWALEYIENKKLSVFWGIVPSIWGKWTNPYDANLPFICFWETKCGSFCYRGGELDLELIEAKWLLA